MAGLLGEFDTMETEIKSERQQLAAQGRAKAGKPPLGTRLTGYTVHGEIIEDEAQIVRDIFARFYAGGSLKGIVRWLTESGVGTRRGRPWSPSSVRDILMNPRYAGRVYYNRRDLGTTGDWSPAAFPALVEEYIFDAVNARLADPRRRKAYDTDRKYLGSGLYYQGYSEMPQSSHAGTP